MGIPTEPEIKERPWKYIGYKVFSEWCASCDDFFVVRRFGSIATRVILRMQWEISKLENQLSALDKESMFEMEEDANNGAFEYDDEERKDVLNQIEKRLKHYCEPAAPCFYYDALIKQARRGGSSFS
jgi:hypothetical protein